MGKLSWLPWMIAAALGGCGSSISDSSAPGPVDPGLHRDAIVENQQRLAGEDVRIVPLYKTPLHAIGLGLDYVFCEPWVHFWEYITHDTAEYAAKKMADASSPDNQRQGMLRLTDFEIARHGTYPEQYAILARGGGDYTVRAAGLRALNRCRAKGYTSLFEQSLSDDRDLIRLEAADALGNIPDPEAVGSLVAHLGNVEPSADVRIACAEALRNYHAHEAMQALIDQLNDPDFAVAWQSRQSLELLTGQDFRYDAKAWESFLVASGT